jgi:hypothetical protein
MPSSRISVRSWVEPGAVPETPPIRPSGVHTIWFLTVCRFFLPEENGFC